VLIIGDTHLPFEHRKYLEFVVDVKKRYHCSLIYHIGDLCDFHAISRHPHNPDGFSPILELKETNRKLKAWYRAFPKCRVCIGNHDERLEKAAWNFGLSSHYMRSLPEIFEFPKGWEYDIDHWVYGVRIFHGMGYGGKYAHVNAVIENQCSIVIGHLHSNAGTWFTANERNCNFGLAVGCGIDRSSYAFQYGRDMRRKPILGCGVVLENGKDALFVPMKL